MEYLTNRKQATDPGSGKSGAQPYRPLQISAVALAVLVLLFILNFGSFPGSPHPEFVAFFNRLFPRIVVALTIIGIIHLKTGAQIRIDGYTLGTTRKVPIIGVTCLTCTAIATGHFALARRAH